VHRCDLAPSQDGVAPDNPGIVPCGGPVTLVNGANPRIVAVGIPGQRSRGGRSLTAPSRTATPGPPKQSNRLLRLAILPQDQNPGCTWR
jgi:hypothetical protein